MVRRNKKISSIVLVIGLALGTIGCNNVSKEKEITTPNTSKVESSISKNNIEKKENNKDNSTLYEKTSNNNNEKVNENKKNIEESNVDSKPGNSNTSNGNSSNNDNNKPSKPNKPSNSNSSNNDNNKPSKPNKPSNSNSSNNDNNKPSKPNKPSNSNSSNNDNNKPSKPNKPSNGNSSNDDNNKPSKPSNDNDKPVKRTWKYMSELSQQTFRALNSFRKANGVEPLKYSSSEQARANEQAKYNARTETGGHDFMQISITSTVDKTAQQFINTWAGSSGHRASMLDSTNVEGAVSVYRDSEGCYYVVASFNDNW